MNAVLLLAGAVFLIGRATIAGFGGEWTGFMRQFEESRLVHVSTLDLIICAASAPFWMSNDAVQRGWDRRWVCVSKPIMFQKL